MGSEGFVKLWRKLRDWPVWRAMSWDQRGVLITLLWNANWKEEQVLDQASMRFVTVPRGSLVTSQTDLAKEVGVGRQTVRSALKILEANPGDNQFLTLEPTSHGTLITILNYGKYQDSPDPDPTSAQPAIQPAGQPTPNQPSLYKKVKKVKKGKKNSSAAAGQSALELGPTPDGWALIALLKKLQLTRDAKHQLGWSATSDKRGATFFDKFLSESQLPRADIEAALHWALGADQSDSYWSSCLNTPGDVKRRWGTLWGQYMRAQGRIPGAAAGSEDDWAVDEPPLPGRRRS